MKMKFLELCAKPITYGAYFKLCGLCLAVWIPMYVYFALVEYSYRKELEG